MPLRDDLDAAAAAGLITPQQAGALEGFLIARRAAPEAAALRGVGADVERVQVARNFNEVFVTIGLVLLLPAVAGLIRLITGGSDALAALMAAAVAWVLAEFLVMRHRMVLPGNLLVLVFAGAAGMVALPVGETQAAAAACVAALVFFLRFTVPFALLAVAVAAVATVLLGIGMTWSMLADGGGRWVLFACGFVAFVVAMIFDARDVRRRTRLSQSAFWLHLVAAPLMVHPVAITLIGTASDYGMAGVSATLIAMAVLLGVIALIVDRRALLVSSLSYLALAIAWAASQVAELAVALLATPLLIGSAVVALGVGWSRARRAVLSLVPLGGLRAYLPPAKGVSP